MGFQPVYVVDGARTPFLKGRNSPGPFAASDLAVQAGRALLIRASCKTDTAGLISSLLGANAEDAGGHFWHDGFLKTNIITPAKWILPNAN